MAKHEVLSRLSHNCRDYFPAGMEGRKEPDVVSLTDGEYAALPEGVVGPPLKGRAATDKEDSNPPPEGIPPNVIYRAKQVLKESRPTRKFLNDVAAALGLKPEKMANRDEVRAAIKEALRELGELED